MKAKHLMFSLKKWLGLGLCSLKNFLCHWYVVIFQNSTWELKIRNKIGIHSQIKKVVHISKPTWKKSSKNCKNVILRIKYISFFGVLPSQFLLGCWQGTCGSRRVQPQWPRSRRTSVHDSALTFGLFPIKFLTWGWQMELKTLEKYFDFLWFIMIYFHKGR